MVNSLDISIVYRLVSGEYNKIFTTNLAKSAAPHRRFSVDFANKLTIVVITCYKLHS